MNLISIVVPVYNEAANIKNLFLEICSVLEKLSKDYKFEIIFVNDGSQDESGNIIRSLEKTFIQIKLIEFTRNFSKEVALSAGLQAAAGSSVILMDADFQHPPELLPHFISEWEGGAEVVIGVRDYQKNIFSVRGFFSSLFNDVMRRLSQLNFREGETDFRLLDNRVVKEFCRFTERRRITRGLLNWLGFRHKYIIFSVPERRGGTSAYTMGKLFKLAIDAFFSYSLLPLRLYWGCDNSLIRHSWSICFYRDDCFERSFRSKDNGNCNACCIDIVLSWDYLSLFGDYLLLY